ncbi:MAG: GNAT family N-acetyltransferase [Actinomycetota bacterium]|nr:GNAT family N-acetyltransferase [Actinomycetota bacterium]
MPATRPKPRVLEGRFIRLEPLDRDHVDELYRAINLPEVFAGGYGGGPAGLQPSAEAFAAWAQTAFRWETGNVYGIRIVGGESDGVLVGTSTLGDFELEKEATHIGWTAYHPSVWSTAVNPEAKLLLLGEAFEHGFGRVRLQADSLNERSRAAIAKLGATFEGVLRRERVRADGTFSGTAIFSVLVDEWSAVRDGLLARLERYGPDPVVARL